MRPYVVVQGDYLAKLALRMGFDADTVWNHASNRALREKRQPDLLHPGDVLQVPEERPVALRLAAGTSNPYRARVPKVVVSLTLTRAGAPIASERCTVVGLGAPLETATQADGTLTLSVPVTVREVGLRFANSNRVHPIRVGDMDPVDERAGQVKRLRHLGHYRDEEDDDPDRPLARAVAAFQTAQGLSATGVVDDATKEALVRAHGS